MFRKLSRSRIQPAAFALAAALALLCGAPSPAQAATNVSGNITSNTTWTVAGSPYILTGNIWVYGNATTVTLTIEAGVEVRFNQNTLLQVGYLTNKGTLVAQGTSAAPILFTSNQTAKTRGYWNGLKFESAATATSQLQYVTVEYAGIGTNNPNVYINGSAPTIANSTIRESGSNGLTVNGAAAPTVQATTIRDNAGVGLSVNAGGTLTLESLTFAGTGGAYSLSLAPDVAVTTSGTHSFDKPIEMRGGDVKRDTTWRKLGTAYVATAQVTVFKDATTASTLTIEPGVEVRFAQNQTLQVGYLTNKGTLLALGTSTAPILFTSNQTSKTRGYWYGLRFDTAATSTSLLEYATVEYGGNSANGGGVHVNGSAPTIRNCTIRESGSYGVRLDGAAAPTLQTTTIRDNTDVGLYMNQLGALAIQTVTVSGTGGTYSMSLPANLTVTTSGTHNFDKPIELRGNVSGNATWRKLGTPYVAWGSIYVYKDATTPATLVIDPGVEVRFAQNQTLQVGYLTNKGTLLALGTPTAPILFTSNQTSKTRGYWYGLRFETAATSASLVEYATVEYGGGSNSANVYINGSSPAIRNSTIRQGGANGVTVAGAGVPLLAANNFVSNTGYGLSSTASTPLEARASWWNDASGPSGAGTGAGEKVTGNVTYKPWLGAAQNPLYLASQAALTKLMFNKTSDGTTFSAALSGTGSWTLQALDAAGTAVKTYSGSGSSVSQAWDGTNSTNKKVADGNYTLKLTATSTGGQAMAPLLARVVVVSSNGPIAKISSPLANAVLRGGDVWPVFGTAADLDNFVSYRVEYGAGSAPTGWSIATSPFDITTAVVDGKLADWNTNFLTGSTYTLRLSVKDGSTTATTQVAVKLITILNFALSRQYFSPNADGIADTTTFSASFSLSSNWTLTIRDASGIAVKTYTGRRVTSMSQAWDGKNTSNAVVPEGAYTYTLDATDYATGVAAAPKTGTVYVDLVKPTAEITSPVANQAIFDTIVITGTAADPSNFDSYTLEYGPGASPTTWNTIRSSSGQVVNGTLHTWVTNSFRDEVVIAAANGTYTIRLTVKDRGDNTATAQVRVVLDNMLITGVGRTSNQIRPVDGQTSTISFTINQPAAVTVRMVAEIQPLKVYPDQTVESVVVRTLNLGTLAAGSHTAVWDGRNDAGQIVLDDAYVYVVEAKAASGRFDKFNQYVSPVTTNVYPTSPSIPTSALSYNPYKNEFVSYDYTLTSGPARGGLRVEWSDSQNRTSVFWPQYQTLLILGTNTAFWDGRDAAGNIVADARSIRYAIASDACGWAFCHITGIKTNYILVQGSNPRLPGVSVKSDPYVIYLSYDQVTRLKYTLLDAASVTVTVKDPQTGISSTILSNVPQLAGDHDVVWEGKNGSGQLGPSEGHYTFTITATHPVSGISTARRGNITVFK